jgi:MoxR-like ATPase
MVMATQNPIEQEGTYPLPEAQLDRFLLHVRIDYPDVTAEKQILSLARQEAASDGTVTSPGTNNVTQEQIFKARREVLDLHLAEPLENYIIELIQATRNPGAYGEDLARWVQYGGSPRATISLDRSARAHAWLAGRDFVSPDDIQAMAPDVLRHRLILNYEAEADGVTTDQVIKALLERVAVP